jgi:hypothetical protein
MQNGEWGIKGKGLRTEEKCRIKNAEWRIKRKGLRTRD